MKILLDAMGGDNAPKSTVQGAADAVKEFGDGMTLALLGDEAKIKAAAQELGVDLTPFELIHCTEDVDMHDDPVKAVRHKTDSSLVKGLTMLKNGEADAFVSAGSTGALHVGTSLIVRTEMLNAFGTMGSVYMNKVMGRKDPAVALVNNGAEDTKGTPMYREAHGLLKANPAIRFVGNIEPRDIMAGEVDVIVCDGFVGNVVLKLTEGVAGTLLGMLKDIFMQSIVTKLCYLGVKGGLRNLKHMMDSEEIGGAPLLGAAKPVIKAHGSSKAKGIKNAIRQAKLCVANDLCGTMQSALAEVAAKAAAEKTDAE